jgi:succinyl-diaminopimelate desuccinylase
MMSKRDRDRVEREVENARDEMVDFLLNLVRIDTTDPPGNNYPECARLIADAYGKFGYDARVVDVPAEYVSTISGELVAAAPNGKIPPRVNVFARARDSRPGRVIHFTGHFDVVPPGDGWTLDPFAGIVREGRVYGRGATDQKSGLAASLFAVEAIRRAGLKLAGTVEQSATVDEEYKGETGLGYLVREGLVGRGKQDFVVITECLDVDGICLGHRGGLFFLLRTHGKVGHGCMPQLAVNAVEKMQAVMHGLLTELRPRVESRVSGSPILPEGSRRSSLSPIWIDSQAREQPGATIPALCASFWNRWFGPEERIDDVRREVQDFLQTLRGRDAELQVELYEAYAAEPVLVDAQSSFVRTWKAQIEAVLGRPGHCLVSPGIDDQHFVVRDGGIGDCILYGPGVLNAAHAPDEHVPVDDLVNAAKVMALSTVELLGVA